MSRTLLVVEDERPLAETLRFNLELEGYRVRTAEDGSRGCRWRARCSLISCCWI